MKTLTALPAVDERSRFGAVSIGYDKIIEVRTEHSALVALAATLLGVDPSQVTIEMVTKLTADVQAAATELDEDTLSDAHAIGARALLGRAAALAKAGLSAR